jgi:hypothetical protein
MILAFCNLLPRKPLTDKVYFLMQKLTLLNPGKLALVATLWSKLTDRAISSATLSTLAGIVVFHLKGSVSTSIQNFSPIMSRLDIGLLECTAVRSEFTESKQVALFVHETATFVAAFPNVAPGRNRINLAVPLRAIPS